MTGAYLDPERAIMGNAATEPRTMKYQRNIKISGGSPVNGPGRLRPR
jgi:hypothetical protein